MQERKEISHAVIDDGAYYGEFEAIGNQDSKIAIVLSGSLYSRATILVNATPDAPTEVYIVKNITPDMVQTGLMTYYSQFVCVPGF